MQMSNMQLSNGGPDLGTDLVKTIQKQQELIHKQHETIAQMIQQLADHKPILAHDELMIHAMQAQATPKPKPPGGSMKKAASLGVIRLDYDYPPAPGDIDHPDSFGYDVFYRVVPGLTFGMCQAGRLTPEVEARFVEAVKWMEGRGVVGITGDCGFMMYQQKLARQHTYLPVFMSSLAQLPAVTCAFNENEMICIMTANGDTLTPMKSLIKDECGVDADHKRFIIVGCQDVPGFEQVALGGKVDTKKVEPGVVEVCRKTLERYPKIRGFLFECTELPPYSDAVRNAFGLPVWDSITGCDYFVSGLKDNVRFGMQGWQREWDGQQADYVYGANLSHELKSYLVNKAAN